MPTINTPAALSAATEQLMDSLATSSLKHYLTDQKVQQHVEQKVQEWAYQAKSNLDQQHPYLTAEEQLAYWLQLKQANLPDFQQLLAEYQAFNQQIGWSDLGDFWQQPQQLQRLQDTKFRDLQFQLLRDKWQRKLTEAVAAWEFEQLALQRDAFLDDMKDFLASLQRMAKHKESLGLDTGIFIDYSKGKLTPQDLDQFQQWCEYLEQDQELLRLAKNLGAAKPSKYPRRAASLQLPPDAHVAMQSYQVQEELVGIQLARDLKNTLPHELALLADPDLEILFDLKYLEENLMSFSMQGQTQAKVIDQQKQQKKQLGQKGPMVLCLDTSGSMHGQPELIAKALSLFLAMQAMKDHRPMYLINFSTQVTTLELTQAQGIEDLLQFLRQSFYGGTDIIPALSHAVDMLEKPNFTHADVIVVSDFIMGHLPEDLMQNIETAKQDGHGFYAVAIGNFRFDHLNLGLFDHQWIYQAKTGQVVELAVQ
jgi:uncharacterized protein with von Willebrand factor type A (vWA) domain